MILLQRIESAVILLGLLFVYSRLEESWWWLVALFIAPDISMIGYLKNANVGAIVYNTGHSAIAPVVLGIAGYVLEWDFGVTLAVIWAIHIAADRMLGFGLKLPTGFRDTHLGKL